MTDEVIPDFKAMSFEELLRTNSIIGNDQFNDALWDEQEKRRKHLNIAEASVLTDVGNYQDKIDERLRKLEAKFEALTKLIDRADLINVPKRSLDQYLEDATK